MWGGNRSGAVSELCLDSPRLVGWWTTGCHQLAQIRTKLLPLHKLLLISGLFGNFCQIWLKSISRFKITAVEEGGDGRETPQFRCFAFQRNLVDHAVHVNLWNKCGFGKKNLVSKPYLLLDGGKKCRLNICLRAQKTYLQEISLWSNLGLSGKTVWEAAGVCEGQSLTLCWT